MGTVILDMGMSLDGFIAGPKDDVNPERELGGLDILHDWRFGGKSSTETEAYEVEKFKPMGAGIVGRRMLDLGIGPWGENPAFHRESVFLDFGLVVQGEGELEGV